MNHRRIMTNLIVHIKQFSREKSTIFFVLMFPILLMLLFGFIFQDTGANMGQLHIQDMDNSINSKALIGAFNATGLFEMIDVDASANSNQFFSQNKLNVLIIIPKGYSDELDMKLINQTNPQSNITILYDQGNSYSQQKMSIIYSVIGSMNKGLSGSVDYIGVSTIPTESEEFNFIDFFAPGIIGMSVMSSALFGTVSMNTELRQKGILKKLATTPLTRSEWLLSNIFYQMFMAMLSTASILAIGMGLFGLRPHINIYMFIFILLCVFSFAGIGMIITRFVKEAESAQAAANAVMFPMLFLSGV